MYHIQNNIRRFIYNKNVFAFTEKLSSICVYISLHDGWRRGNRRFCSSSEFTHLNCVRRRAYQFFFYLVSLFLSHVFRAVFVCSAGNVVVISKYHSNKWNYMSNFCMMKTRIHVQHIFFCSFFCDLFVNRETSASEEILIHNGNLAS